MLVSDELLIDPLVEKLFEKTDKPNSTVLQKLNEQVSYIRKKLNDYPLAPRLLDEVFGKELQYYPISAAAIILATDFDKFDSSNALVNYLGRELRKSSGELELSIQNALIRIRDTRDIAVDDTVLTFGKIKTNFTVGQLEQAFNDNLLVPGQDSSLSERIANSLYEKLEEQILEVYYREKQRGVEKKRGKVKDDPEPPIPIESNQIGADDVRDKMNPLFAIGDDGQIPEGASSSYTYISRSSALDYLAKYNKHIWEVRAPERIKIIFNKIVDGISLNVNDHHTDENDRIIAQIQEDFNTSNLRELFFMGESAARFKNGLGKLVMAYVILDELKQGLADCCIVSDKESFVENLSRTDNPTTIMGQIFVIDIGTAGDNRSDLPNEQRAATFAKRPPRIPNEGEANGSLSYFRTGHTDYKIFRKTITFDQISLKIRNLMVASFLEDKLKE